jgi:hypothetical protein
MIKQVQVTPEAVESLQKLKLAPNEGVMLVKFVLFRQETLTAGQAQEKIDSSPPGLLLGDVDEMKATLTNWLNEAIELYKKG